MVKTVRENSVSLEIFGGQENRLDIGKRFLLLGFDLQKSRAHELGRIANYNLQTSDKSVKQVQKVKERT